MHCQYCGQLNGEDDHRCLNCGRRITGVVIAAPTSYIGATALAMAPAPSARHDQRAEASPAPAQPDLFSPQQSANPGVVIPFEEVQRQRATRLGQPIVAPAKAAPAVKPSAPQRPASRAKQPAIEQGNLDFRSASGDRILSTGAPAQVSGNARVAPPVQRLIAGAIDASMVVIGFGIFATTVKFGGAAFGSGKAVWIALALSFVLISLFYGMVWSIGRRETAGMNLTGLQLVTFDGSPLDGRNRTIRFAAAWLSYCSGGLGLLWCLADEENLAFHDHISKTYPAERGSNRPFVRQRR